MPTKAQILEFIASNPGASNHQIAAAFGPANESTTASMATRTKKLLEQGRVTRERIGSTVTGVPRYGYTIVAGPVAQRTPGPKPAARDNVGKAMDNVGASLSSLLDQMAKQLADQIVSRARAHLQVELSSLVPPEPVVLAASMPSIADILSRAPALPAPQQQKPKVLVMGLLPKQAGQMQTEFHDAMELHFWNDRVGDSMDRLKTLAKHADIVFAHTDHLAHKHTELVEARGARWIRVPGGLSQMRDALTKYYVEEVTA